MITIHEEAEKMTCEHDLKLFKHKNVKRKTESKHELFEELETYAIDEIEKEMNDA